MPDFNPSMPNNPPIIKKTDETIIIFLNNFEMNLPDRLTTPD